MLNSHLTRLHLFRPLTLATQIIGLGKVQCQARCVPLKRLSRAIHHSVCMWGHLISNERSYDL